MDGKLYVRLAIWIKLFKKYFKNHLQVITSECLLVALQVFLSMSDEQEQSEVIPNHPTKN